MKVKTSELIGAALDYAVAVALGLKIRSQKRDGVHKGAFIAVGDAYGYIWRDTHGWVPRGTYCWSPSTRWDYGGQLVDALKISIFQSAESGVTEAFITAKRNEVKKFPWQWKQVGPTPLIAICRAVVACKMGDEVEVPDCLINGEQP